MRSVIKIGLCLIAIAIAWTLGFEAFCPVPRVAPPLPVRAVAVPVQQHDLPLILGGFGTVQALTSTIRSQVMGLLRIVNFVEGQIPRGDAFALMSPRPHQAHREQAQLANAQTTLERSLPLL